jgi:hypothetical protein
MRDIDETIEQTKAELLPYESWERLAGESGMAYAAFCKYRDYGSERNIRRAVEGSLSAEGADSGKIEKRYRMWRGWAVRFRWRERAAEYDRYLDRLKQREKRKTIEGQEAVYRETTKKMLQMVNKKLDLMKPGELTQGAVKEWVEAAVRTDREIGQFANANCLGVCGSRAAGTSRNSTPSQMEINFTPEFEGL